MKIARLTDRFIIKMGEISIEVSPLSGREKVELAGFSSWKEGKIHVDKPRQELFVIKHTVKDVHGVTDMDDHPYKLAFDGNVLTDDCADEVLGLLASTWFTYATLQLASSGVGKVISPINGQPVEGVEIFMKEKPKEDEAETEKK